MSFLTNLVIAKHLLMQINSIPTSKPFWYGIFFALLTGKALASSFEWSSKSVGVLVCWCGLWPVPAFTPALSSQLYIACIMHAWMRMHWLSAIGYMVSTCVSALTDVFSSLIKCFFGAMPENKRTTLPLPLSVVPCCSWGSCFLWYHHSHTHTQTDSRSYWSVFNHAPQIHYVAREPLVIYTQEYP